MVQHTKAGSERMWNMEYFLLDELSNILREGVCDLNVAAKRLRVALPVVERTFADGVLKGYWKVANGKLLIKSHHHHRSTGCDHVPPVHLPPEIAWNPGSGFRDTRRHLPSRTPASEILPISL
jgi:hypothetical protein